MSLIDDLNRLKRWIWFGTYSARNTHVSIRTTMLKIKAASSLRIKQGILARKQYIVGWKRSLHFRADNNPNFHQPSSNMSLCLDIETPLLDKLCLPFLLLYLTCSPTLINNLKNIYIFNLLNEYYCKRTYFIIWQ